MAPASFPERCPNPAPRQLIRATAARGEQRWSRACPARSSPPACRVCPAVCLSARLQERSRCGAGRLAPCRHQGCWGWCCCCCRRAPRCRPGPRPRGKCASHGGVRLTLRCHECGRWGCGRSCGAVCWLFLCLLKGDTGQRSGSLGTSVARCLCRLQFFATTHLIPKMHTLEAVKGEELASDDSLHPNL